MAQNHMELFQKTIHHKPHRDVLYYASFTEDVEQRLRKHLNIEQDVNLGEHLDMYRPVEVTMKSPRGYTKPEYHMYFDDMDIPKGGFINTLGVLEIPGSLYHFTRYVSPLRNAVCLEDLIDFKYPSVDKFTSDHMQESVEHLHSENKVTCCCITHMYEDAWQIRGYEAFLMDMATQPEMCEFILDRICEKNIIKAEAAARAGVDVLVTGDDVANQRALMFSKDMWRKFLKVRWARVYEAARRIKKDIQIWYHSDGNIEEIIPELIEIGVTILNPVQPECLDPVKIKSLYGDRIVIDGTIGTQSTIPFGSPKDIKMLVRDMRTRLGYDGALILSPTHILEPEVPVQNIMAFIEACREG
jgi:uroporphyrinogen decarboxylase